VSSLKCWCKYKLYGYEREKTDFRYRIHGDNEQVFEAHHRVFFGCNSYFTCDYRAIAMADIIIETMDVIMDMIEMI